MERINLNKLLIIIFIIGCKKNEDSKNENLNKKFQNINEKNSNIKDKTYDELKKKSEHQDLNNNFEQIFKKLDFPDHSYLENIKKGCIEEVTNLREIIKKYKSINDYSVPQKMFYIIEFGMAGIIALLYTNDQGKNWEILKDDVNTGYAYSYSSEHLPNELKNYVLIDTSPEYDNTKEIEYKKLLTHVRLFQKLSRKINKAIEKGKMNFYIIDKSAFPYKVYLTNDGGKTFNIKSLHEFNNNSQIKKYLEKSNNINEQNQLKFNNLEKILSDMKKKIPVMEFYSEKIKKALLNLKTFKNFPKKFWINIGFNQVNTIAIIYSNDGGKTFKYSDSVVGNLEGFDVVYSKKYPSFMDNEYVKLDLDTLENCKEYPMKKKFKDIRNYMYYNRIDDDEFDKKLELTKKKGIKSFYIIEKKGFNWKKFPYIGHITKDGGNTFLKFIFNKYETQSERWGIIGDSVCIDEFNIDELGQEWLGREDVNTAFQLEKIKDIIKEKKLLGHKFHFGFKPLMGPIRHVFITDDGKKFKEILPDYIKIDDTNYLNYKLDKKYKEYKSIYDFK